LGLKVPRLVICREDLPVNPNWRLENYPMHSCWDIDEFMASDLVPYSEKRRIYWECYWRLLGRYRRKRPFFDTYLVNRKIEKVDPRRWKWVCENVIVSAMEHDVVPPEAKEATARLYKRIFGRLVSVIRDI